MVSLEINASTLLESEQVTDLILWNSYEIANEITVLYGAN